MENDPIEWRGGPCPVDPMIAVDVKFGDDQIVENITGYRLVWSRNTELVGPSDIVAYRLSQAAAAANDPDAQRFWDRAFIAVYAQMINEAFAMERADALLAARNARVKS